MKISKLLPISLAMMLGVSGAFAADPITAQADYELQLNEYFNVVAAGPAEAATVTYGGDYDTITVSNISGTFDVTSNTDTKDIFFYGTCKVSEGEVAALYGTADEVKLVFTNTQIGNVNNKAVTLADVSSIRGNVKDPTKSPNAIVLKLDISSELTAGSFPVGKAISALSFDGTNNVKFSIPNCKAKFTVSTGGGAMDNSFSTLDTNGLYRATIYLSDTKQTI